MFPALNMTYSVMDNENYALTTGQAIPATPIGAKTKTTPDGNLSAPFDPIKIAKQAGCKFAKWADLILTPLSQLNLREPFYLKIWVW